MLGLLIAYLSFIHLASSPAWDTDYKYLYFSAQQLLKHADIYSPLRFFSPSLNGITEMVNLNPPFVTILMAPLGWLSYSVSFWTGSFLNLGLQIVSVVLIIRRFFQPQQEKFLIYLVSVLFLLAYFPTFISMYAPTGGLVFFLTTLGWLSFRENKTGLAGFFWGIAFSTKLFIGLFLWMLIWRKEWRCLSMFLLSTVICGLLTILILGTDIYLKYYAVFAKVSWYSASWNASLLGFFSRLLGYANEQNHAWVNYPRMTQIFYGIAVVILLAAFVFFQKSKKIVTTYFSTCRGQAAARRQLDRSKQLRISNDLVVAYTIVALLMISPLAWIYYFSLLLIPCAIIFYWNRQFFHQPSLDLFLAGALFLSSVPHLLLEPRKIVDGYHIFWWSGCYFYALCILGILVFAMTRLFDKGMLRQKSSLKPSLLAILFVSVLLPSFLGILTIIYLLATA